jgi:serine/threonine protein kinase
MNRLPRRPVLPLDDRVLLGDDVVNRFVFEGVVGRGTYGTVFKVVSKASRQVRAVKENNVGKAGDGFTRDAVREVALLKELSHPNILSPSTAVISLSKMYLEFDYAEFDLSAVIRHFHRSGVVPLPVVKFVMRQLLQGIQYMHSKLIMHRDLKPDNILIVSSNSCPPVVKIADFGMARVFAEPPAPLYFDGTVCTIWYRAPELFLGSMNYTAAVDIWSAGCIFAELLAADAVFKGSEDKEGGLYVNQLFKIISRIGLPSCAIRSLRSLPKWDRFWAACEHMRPVSPLQEWLVKRGCSPDAKAIHLLQQMLHWDPESRCSASEALQHPFFDAAGDKMDGGNM